MTPYDSRPETQAHIDRVRHFVSRAIFNLRDRAIAHDASNLYGAFWCRFVGHAWKRWDGGHVHAGDDWAGDWNDGHPWSDGFSECQRCGVQGK